VSLVYLTFFHDAGFTAAGRFKTDLPLPRLGSGNGLNLRAMKEDSRNQHLFQLWSNKL
jgi:hypothetical protein